MDEASSRDSEKPAVVVTADMVNLLYSSMRDLQESVKRIQEEQQNNQRNSASTSIDPTSVREAASTSRMPSLSDSDKEYPSRTVQRRERLSRASESQELEDIQPTPKETRKRFISASESHLHSKSKDSRRDSQFWDDFDGNLGGNRKAIREIREEHEKIKHSDERIRRSRASAGAGAGSGHPDDSNDSEDSSSSSETSDSDIAPNKRQLKKSDRAKMKATLAAENRALRHRIKEMITLGEWDNQAPTVIKTHRTMPSTEKIKLDGLEVWHIIRFMRRLAEYEAQNQIFLNPVQHVDLSVKTRLQAYFLMEGIASDSGWLKQSRTEFFSRLQAISRPRSQEAFIAIMNSSVTFREGFQNAKERWDEFLVAVHVYAERFRNFWVFMSRNNEENTPNIDNKEYGAIKIFLSKFPNSFGQSLCKQIIRERYRDIRVFIADFLTLVNEQRNRLVALQDELLKFGPKDAAATAAKATFKETPKKPFTPFNKSRSGFQRKTMNAIRIEAQDSDGEFSAQEDPEDNVSETDVVKTGHSSRLGRELELEPDSEDEGEELAAMEQPKKAIEQQRYACYSMAMFGRCDKGKDCRKNHATGACEQYVMRTLETLLQSPNLRVPEAQALVKRYLIDAKQPQAGAHAGTFTRPKSLSILRSPAAATADMSETVNAVEEILTSIDGQKLRPMYVEGKLDFTDEVFHCLLDTGASHSNYVRKAFLKHKYPNYQNLQRRVESEVRTGNNARISIEYEITLPLTLFHNGVSYSAEVTCAILEDSNTNLIIGLPTLACEFYELTLILLREARQFYQDGATKVVGNEVWNVVIHDLPYHNEELNDRMPVDAFDDTLFKAIAEEEMGIWEHTPDSFPGAIDVMDQSAEEKFKEFKEQQQTRVSLDLPKRDQFVKLLDDYFTIFHQWNYDGINFVDPIDIQTREDMPKQHKPEFRFVSFKNEDAFHKEINRLKESLYKPSISPIVHPVVVAPKATDPFLRVCGDYRWLNQFILKPHWPIPSVKEAMQILQKGNIYGEADITNSFHQLRLTPRAMELLSVSIPKHGCYSPTKMPEGVSSASEHLQRIMTQIFEDFIQQQWLLVIFDNIVVVAMDVDDLLAKSKLFFERCKTYNLFLKFKKCTFGFPEINFFGYRVSNKGYYLLPEKVEALDAWQFPRNTKKMQSFLGFTLFFAPFIPAYSEKASRLYELVHKDFNWKDPATWKHDYIKIFQDFKESLKTTYMICFPNYDLEWQLFTDASDLGVAGVLFQVNILETGEKRLEVIAFVSHKFSEVALRWSTIDKECFAIFHTLKVLKRMLWGKTFICYTDHANLQQLAKSDVFKLQRWAQFMATFDMKVIHVPGSKNPADAGSRSFGDLFPKSLTVLATWTTPTSTAIGGEESADVVADEVHSLVGAHIAFGAHGTVNAFSPIEDATEQKHEELTIPAAESSSVSTADDLFQQVHNSKIGHWGVARTYQMANKLFPGHHLPIRFFQDKVASCSFCQKFRNGLVGTLEPLTLHMKVQTRRAAIGADVLKITPPDKHGHIGLLVIVTMATKLVSLHALRDETSMTLAKEFFTFYSRYGLYDVVSVDPGSNISQSVVEELNNLMGMKMKISLVDRHESNGAESTNGQVLRHIRMLVQEPRAKDSWGDPTYLACVQYILNSHINAEASDVATPFELTFGTEAAPYYQTVGEKILNLDPKGRSIFLAELNEHLKEIWEVTKRYQKTILDKRIPPDKPTNSYQSGDLVLHLEAKRPTKLAAEFSGPYKVVNQQRNNVEARHLTSGVIKFLHVSRLKPFFGTDAEAYEMATRDKDQFVVDKILAYRGDPDRRTSLEFLVRFADADTKWIPWSRDLFDSIPYEAFVRNHRHLFPLLFPVDKAKTEVKKLSGQIIEGYNKGDVVLVNLRSYGELWYQALPLPDLDTVTYAVPYKVVSVAQDRRSLQIESEVYKGKVKIDSYYLFAFIVDPATVHVEVNSGMLEKYPALRA